MSMYKVIPVGSWDFGMEPSAIMKVSSHGLTGQDRKDFFSKRAGSGMFEDLVSKIALGPGDVPIHTIAIGATERYGANRNGDGFSLDTCRKHASSFTCKPLRDYVKHAHNGARYFMHHKNDDPEKSFGYVKAAAFNEPMGRIELLIIGNGTKEAAHRNGGFVLPDNVLEELHRGDFVGGSMSCFRDPDLPILTKDNGYKRIADIVAGDYVWTDKARWQKVTVLRHHFYTGKIYSLKLRGLPLEFDLTADHPMLAKVIEESVAEVGVSSRSNGRSFKTGALDDVPSDWTHVSHMAIGDKLIAVPVTKFPGYTEIESCGLAAIMGYYAAEGSLMYNSDRASSVIFTCHASDSAVRRIPKIINDFWPDLSVKIRPKANSKVAMELAIYNTEFAELIRLLCKAGSRQKVIPPEIFNSSKEVKLSYLGAWLDGDGWFDKKGGHWSSVNLGLILQGRDLLLSLGCPSSVYKIKHTKSKGSSPEKPCYEYTLNISNLNIGLLKPYSEKARDFPEIVVDPANSNRQRVLIPLKDGSYAMSIKSIAIEDVENIMVYNFEVEGDESYSAAGLVSHNCKIAYDVCQICNNKAASRKYYCDSDSCVAPDGVHGFGCKEGLTKLLKSGKQQFVENPNPIFFDFSYVGRPADRTAYGGIAREFLGKAASDNSIVKGGAWLAELNGMFADGIRTPSSDYNARQLKLARELADLEKAMDSTEDAHVKLAFSPKVQETLDLNPMGEVGTQKFAGALKALANAGAILTLEDFLAITAPAELRATLKSAASQVRQALPFVFRKLASREDLVELLEHPFAVSPAAVPSLEQKHWAAKVAKSRCCCECNLSKRASLAVLRGEKMPVNKPLIKQASEDIVVGQLAEKYALYQLATLAVNEKSQSVLTLRAVLAHNRC